MRVVRSIIATLALIWMLFAFKVMFRHIGHPEEAKRATKIVADLILAALGGYTAWSLFTWDKRKRAEGP